MDAKILKFTGITVLPEAPETFLDKAKDWRLDRCMLLGFNEQNEFVIGGSFSERAEMFMLLELARHWLLHSNPIPIVQD